MNEIYDILTASEEGIKHAKHFRYELFRDEKAELVTECYHEATENNMLHFHECIEILYAVGGSLYITVDGIDSVLHDGDFAVISSYLMHDCIVSDETERWVVLIPLSLLGRIKNKLEGKMFDKYIVHDDGTVLSIIRLLKKVHKEESILLNNYDNDLRRDTESLLASSLISVAVNICGLKDQQRSSIIMVELLKYLHLNFRRDIHIPDLSRMLLCSQKTLSDQFKRIFGMTIRAYINHLRAIDVMTNIRENKDMSLYEATEISGFGSVQNMLRAYKKEFGCTPKESKVNQGK